MSINETIFEPETKKEQDQRHEEAIVIDSDCEEVDQPIIAIAEEKAKKPRRGRPPKKMTDEKQINKLKINLVEGRTNSIITRRRNALLKKIDEEEARNIKKSVEDTKINNYNESNKIVEPRIQFNLFKPFIF